MDNYRDIFEIFVEKTFKVYVEVIPYEHERERCFLSDFIDDGYFDLNRVNGFTCKAIHVIGKESSLKELTMFNNALHIPLDNAVYGSVRLNVYPLFSGDNFQRPLEALRKYLLGLEFEESTSIFSAETKPPTRPTIQFVIPLSKFLTNFVNQEDQKGNIEPLTALI